jgi:class 3 adenylate cyclase
MAGRRPWSGIHLQADAMPRVFISYRRDDASGHAGRLYDDLSRGFGREQIFMDVDAIDLGADFVEIVEQAVDASDVMIAMIGKRWLTAADARNRRRLHDPDDFVRLEIATALGRNKRIIPILVQGAAMPRPDALPDDLKLLVRRNALEVRDTSWSVDVARLVRALGALGGLSRTGPDVDAPEVESATPDLVASVGLSRGALSSPIDEALVVDKEAVRTNFGHVLSPSVVEKLVDNPGMAKPGGSRREVTVLFADIRGFTRYSERYTPEEVLSTLNSILTRGAEVVLAAGGTLDKFIGDATMAFFNAPVPQEDHVLAAVRAATLLMARAEELRASGQQVSFAVGVDTGMAIVGYIGTAGLGGYSVIGDTVNVAARLQGEARGGEILVSRSSYERIAGLVEVEEIGKLHVQGRLQAVEIYKVVRLLEGEPSRTARAAPPRTRQPGGPAFRHRRTP